MSTNTAPTPQELSDLFMAGRYDEATAGLRAMRPDLSEADLISEFALAIKVLSKSYADLRKDMEHIAAIAEAGGSVGYIAVHARSALAKESKTA